MEVDGLAGRGECNLPRCREFHQPIKCVPPLRGVEVIELCFKLHS